MWPWEHLAFGYVLYSLVARVVNGDSPRGDAVVVVALATQLPDLVDKPLAWSFDITATGYSIGHSMFVAPFVVFAVSLLAIRVDRPHLSLAFAVGYGSHLVGDIVYPIVRGQGPAIHAVLWPLIELEGTNDPGLVAQFSRYFDRFLREVTAADPSPVLTFNLALAVFVGLLWAVDGFPVVSDLYRAAVGRQRK
ncbi:metal-dependent hydrolase [Haloarchaeobius sp. DFWS5]|uniref:metal-dependent hydrolase n=1 Tax=Haloarchaeobius sp. DFWS5 TaxID=3446114 RepID=UPI003EBC3478